MTKYPLLITLERHNCYQTYRLEYRQGKQLEQDCLTLGPSIAEQASAAGWLQGGIPVVQDQGQISHSSPCQILCKGHGGRVSPDSRWQWRLQPQQGWPPPFRLLEWDRHSGREDVIWEKPGWEILDLQLDPRAPGLYFAVQPPLGKRRLLHWNPLRRQLQCVMRHADFRPIEFTMAPDGASLAFVHQEDDQLYRLDLASPQLHQLSIPQLEVESQQGYRAYRTSPAYSPDGRRLFYCTAYLELCDLDLSNWGNVYCLPAQGGALRRLEMAELDDGCPINLCPPTAGAWLSRPLALAS